MSRAYDIGNQYPSDSNDSLPDDPTSFCQEMDYLIPGKYQSSITKSGSGATRIDLKRTAVIDSDTYQRSTLSSLLRIVRHPKRGVGVLAVKTDSEFIDPITLHTGPLDLVWDAHKEKWVMTPPEEFNPWWGKVISITWPSATVRRMQGSIESLIVPVDPIEKTEIHQDEVCYAGKVTGIQINDEVYVQWSGEDIQPKWTIEQRLAGIDGQIPLESELAANQDVSD